MTTPPAEPPTVAGAPTAADPSIEIADVNRMRALAHPARLAIMEFLGRGKPATATECAEIVGLSPSATSYHLRALARAGLVEEAANRGDGRERLWTTVSGHMRIQGGPTDDPVQREAEMGLFAALLAWQDARSRRFLQKMYDLPTEWRDAGALTERTIVATPAELDRLVHEVDDLVAAFERERRAEIPADARRVSFIVRALPSDDESPGLRVAPTTFEISTSEISSQVLPPQM